MYQVDVEAGGVSLVAKYERDGDGRVYQVWAYIGPWEVYDLLDDKVQRKIDQACNDDCRESAQCNEDGEER